MNTNILNSSIMKKTLTCFFSLALLFIASSCTDPNADELYELNKHEVANNVNTDKGHSEGDNPPPAP